MDNNKVFAIVKALTDVLEQSDASLQEQETAMTMAANLLSGKRMERILSPKQTQTVTAKSIEKTPA